MYLFIAARPHLIYLAPSNLKQEMLLIIGHMNLILSLIIQFLCLFISAYGLSLFHLFGILIEHFYYIWTVIGIDYFFTILIEFSMEED